jgi:uncharacterized protein YceH (UPF0502 family)
VRLASGRGSRAVKYRHLFDEAVGVSTAEIALLAVLMLRGPQTLGELKQRSERLHPFASLAEVAETLDALTERELAARRPRAPGQKEDRYAQLLGDSADAPPAAPEQAAGDPLRDLEHRLARLENEVAALRRSIGAERAPGSPA